MSLGSDYFVALKMQEHLNALDGEIVSDIEEVDCKKPIAKLEPSKKPLKIKRSNPHSNLDEDYINRKEKLLHPQWDSLDPTPDILALFRHFDTKFFQGRLKSVTLEWSKRMFSCSGISYSLRNGVGTDVTILLSEPLLKLRSRKDLVETMLHQMIHSYLFLLNILERSGGHGANFKRIMLAINKVSGTNITIDHTLHDDLNYHKQHWWRCNGICQDRGPFFGYVQTQSSSGPDNDDQWYAKHQELCGGTFMKIKGPDIPEKTNKLRPARDKGKENATKVSAALDVSCDDKRRRISDQANSTHQAKNKWVAVDEEVMLKDYQEPVITLSSDDDEEEDSDIDHYNGENHKNITIEERHSLIKQEIIAESIDLCDTDFQVIGDVADDNMIITTSSKLTDTRIIDDFFCDDILMAEFKTDNDCKPSSSRYQYNPDNDIVKCSICEHKLQRRDYAQHLNGCAGISKKILPHRKALKKLSAISKEARPRKQSRPSAHNTRDILRNAGYTEAQLARISSADETEEDIFLGSSSVKRESSLGNTTATNGSPEILNISSEDENTIRYRQRNLYRTTKECPICMEDVEELEMNDHLDDCLRSKRPRRVALVKK